ncbi:hypothetical protein [Haloplanus natans]|uniref:hypothetical protein n=1 Tax=Haloplanus natans TaxID=376171 RepID=UPI000677A535|nr:hypothetical protein [Haloplanus natans]
MIRASWLLTGLCFLLLGLYGSARPDELARFTERVDALGSKRDIGSVEPTDLNVRLTRLVSLFSTLCGVAIVGLAVAPV